MMFRDIVDKDAGWRLRHTLQTEPRIILLASATSRFDEIGNPDYAFYDLLRELTLRPLDSEECAGTLAKCLWPGCTPPGNDQSVADSHRR